MKMSAVIAEKCNSLSQFVDIVYSCFLIMYCIVSYCVLCLYLICYLYTNESTKVTRNKDIYKNVHYLGMTITHLLGHNPVTFPTITMIYCFHFVV